MLPAAHRLRRSTDFAAAVRGGKRSGRGSLVVHLAYSEPALIAAPGFAGGSARAGFVVSRAVGKAVLRNKVKRRLRHLVAARIDGLPAGCVLVVRALPRAGRTPYPQLGRDLDAALQAALRQQAPRSQV